MTNAEFIESLDLDVLFRHILVDGEEFTLDTFLECNMLDKDVTHISIEDAQAIVNLHVNESIMLWTSEIKRIS